LAKGAIMNNPVKKWFLKRWTVQDKFTYDIYQVIAGKDVWFMAEPVNSPCVVRTAENETILKILLENDCINATRFQQKVR
jgi:hypothetical protein